MQAAMSARTYSFAIIGTALLFFWSAVAANVLLDPLSVFWRDPSVRLPMTNERNAISRNYLASPDRYGGFFFSSSRGYVMPLEELSRDFGGVTVFRFSMKFGNTPDYLLLLKFLLRDKQSRHSRLQAIFLLLDIDTFGNEPISSGSAQELWPPQVTGGAAAPFWWRNLTAIQFDAWKTLLRRSDGPRAENESRHGLLGTLGDGWAQSIIPEAAAQTGNSKPPAPQPSISKDRVRARIYYREQLAMLREFAELCSKNQIRLVAAIAPLLRIKASQLDEEDARLALEDISHILPIWDFGVPQWLESEWSDHSHFSPMVAHLMLERIFQANPPSPREGFGVLRGN
jgi:hypothetical protein